LGKEIKNIEACSNHDKMKSRVIERKSETLWSLDKHDNMKVFIGKSI